MHCRQRPIAGVEVRELGRYCDERGWLSELFRNDAPPGGVRPVMGYVSVTHPGTARGPHVHLEQTDVFAFVGPGTMRVRLWDVRGVWRELHGEVRYDPETYREEEVACNWDALAGREVGYMEITAGEDTPLVVVVPPGIVHGYRAVGDGDAVCLNFPDRLYRGEGKKYAVDEIRYEKREGCPFEL